MRSHKSSQPDAAAIQAEFEDYAYIVSHDLSAPVRAMVEFSKILATEHLSSLSPEGKECLSLIAENGQKLQEMMEGLLQYSRINSAEMNPVQVPVGKIIDDCRRKLQKQISATGATFDVGTLPPIKADVELLTQVFYILLDNAIKFQPKNGTPRITISAGKVDECWRFAVADNGIGIPPPFQDKIFKLFARLNDDDDYPGVGAGLTLASKALLKQGGEIWCESTPGKGSTFYFNLPSG